MTQFARHDQLSTDTTPASAPTLEGVQQRIDTAHYPSQLRAKRFAPDLARLLMKNEITPTQYDELIAQAADKRSSLSVQPTEPPEGPPEPLTPSVELAPTHPEEWSPTANLGEPRTDFSPFERAAGEQLDRQR